MEKKKSNKGLIVLVVILAILLVGSIVGYICYDKFMVKNLPSEDKKPVSDVASSDDFYLIDNLVKNHYIKKMSSTDSGSIKIKDGSVYYDSTGNGKLVKDTIIKEEPVSVYSVRDGGPAAPLSLYVLTKDNNLYYRIQDSFDYGDGESMPSNVHEFVKINAKKIVNVYTGYLDKLSDNFIGVDFGDGNLYIHSAGGFTTTYKDYIEYPDFQVAYATGDGILWRISKDKKLYSFISTGEDLDDGYYKEVTYNKKAVVIKNTFSGYVKDDIVNFVIDSDNNLLSLPFDNKDKTTLSLYNNSKVKDVKYVKDKDENYSVSVTLEDGTSIYVTSAELSSLYLRNNS